MRKIEPCIVIGIAGGSGSGKTTYSNNLGKSLDKFKVKIISTDDYFKELKPIVKAPYNGKEFVDYDHPTSVDLDRLSRDFNHAISSNLFDIVIVEGLMVLYFEEIREKINLKIYVDCPSDERLVRRIKRDNNEETFEEITSEYLDLVRHRHNEFVEPTKWYADLILNGSKNHNNSIEVILRWVFSY
ncbi:uridine kinase family protein [Niallia sp. MER TA 168]|uniref:uridine kinase family protein n=1 Tax=Niallia sp. MER TA 168 TaxID=2939568 RepID=UPI00203E8C8F|nr:AAA family ATPase [Niallia sp. MER TA 168]MCM3361237.1 AAA family ATPase [Niallia sp. MER TA 168]